MAHPKLTLETLPAFIAAIEQVKPDSPAEWGSLNAHRMLAHLKRANFMALGRVDVPNMGNFLSRTKIARKMIFEIMPWPKGKIKAPPEFTPEPEGDFEEERAAAIAGFEEFVAELERDPNREVFHPMLGDIPYSYWSVILGRHTAWHLRQFGVKVDA